MKTAATIYRFRWQIIALWAAATAVLLLVSPKADPTAGLTRDLLPADSPFHRALQEYAERFHDKSSMSQAVVVLEREDAPLTPRDLDDAEEVGARLIKPGQGESPERFRDITINTPRSLGLLGAKNPLISADGKAAIICLNLPYNDGTTDAVRMVNRVHAIVDAHPFQPGLRTAVTGSAGFTRDYLMANERSHDKITLVTIVSVITVLLLVYRAPIAAIIPLLAIGMTTAMATKLVIIGQALGLSSGTAERLFMLVLLFGAGVDYSLLFIGRYKEFLDSARPPQQAFLLSLDASIGAILASAVTTASGLGVLCFARFGVFRDVGPAIVLALLAAGIASATLVPAMVAVVGPKVFWPRRGKGGHESAAQTGRQGSFWPAMAGFVTKRPALVLLLTLAALTVPAWRGSTLSWSYDAHASLPESYDAIRGMDIVRRHWSIGEISPVRVLVVSPSPQSFEKWTAVSARIISAVRLIPGVCDVRGITAPLGLKENDLANAGMLLLGGRRIQSEFVSPDGRAMWLSAVLEHPPQSLAAMDDADKVRSVTDKTLAQAAFAAQTHLSGATAETMDLRSVTQDDFRRLAVLSLSVILLIVVALLRDLLLSLFMVAGTVVGYLATLGLTYWAFWLFAGKGLDWEVEAFLFIVLVAVGQDYNIFFAVRLAQESRSLGVAAATRQALIHTGHVISSCGVIMAATLGSMVVGDIKMLRQLGFALALGMLIDTFIVRPLLLPGFIVLTRRTLSKAAKFVHVTSD